MRFLSLFGAARPLGPPSILVLAVATLLGCGDKEATVTEATTGLGGDSAVNTPTFPDTEGATGQDIPESTPDVGDVPDTGGTGGTEDVGEPDSVLCNACEMPVDCAFGADFSAHCIVRASGDGYCGAACGADKPCPEGFECLLTESMSASAVSQCLPALGGNCPGDEGPKCEPFELCNGIDDDCDGATDEETCDDGNECTTDQCLGPDGCSSVAVDGGSCDDGKPCTLNDECQGGECTGELGDGCDPGEPGVLPCGNCGTQSCTCNDTCTYENCSTCMNEGLCSVGDTDDDSQVCNGCGTQVRTRTCGGDCQWGPFSDWGSCSSAGTCTPGGSEQQSEACGNCGMRTQTRVCSAGCEWGGWSDWSGCSGQGQCAAGATQTSTEACGNCGTKKQTRTCSAQCTWGNYGAFGSCTSQGACSPGAVAASDCDSCAEKKCSNSCQWSGCQLKAGAECLHEGGSNWRCCGGGKWQFCLPPIYGCKWSDQCENCSGCGC
ncbi:MAG: hypothetical protein ACI9OJ_000894 [Myxococcota bacterium]|jgi:hypothetical protein